MIIVIIVIRVYNRRGFACDDPTLQSDYLDTSNMQTEQHKLAVSANPCTLGLQLWFDLLLHCLRLLTKSPPQYLST